MSSTRIICLSDNIAPSGGGYWAEHGLSFYIKSGGIKVLYDTGQSGDVLLHNALLAGVNLSGLDYIVLSHGHYDHSGGLLKVLKMNEGVPLVVHPAVFLKKFARREGGLRDISLPFELNELKEHCELQIESGPVDLGGGISITGEIARITSYEVPQQDLLVEKDGGLIADKVLDDQSLVLSEDGKLMLLCGCCHSGIVNTIECVKNMTGRYPAMIAGGLHMKKADEFRLSSTAEALRAAGVKNVLTGHCSGNEILSRLSCVGISVGRLAAGMNIL